MYLRNLNHIFMTLNSNMKVFEPKICDYHRVLITHKTLSLPTTNYKV